MTNESLNAMTNDELRAVVHDYREKLEVVEMKCDRLESVVDRANRDTGNLHENLMHAKNRMSEMQAEYAESREHFVETYNALRELLKWLVEHGNAEHSLIRFLYQAIERIIMNAEGRKPTLQFK